MKSGIDITLTTIHVGQCQRVVTLGINGKDRAAMKIDIIKKQNTLAKAFADTLESINGQVEYRKLTIVEELLQFMKRHNINRSELAERMGVVPGRITKLLNGTENLTIETLVRAGHAVGADLVQTFVPKGQRGQWVGFEPPVSHDRVCTTVYFLPKAIKQAPTPSLGIKQPAERDAEDAANLTARSANGMMVLPSVSFYEDPPKKKSIRSFAE